MTERSFAVGEAEALEFLAYLTASAELCITEPHYYGTFRLIEAASRLMGLMREESEAGDPWLARFKSEVDEKKLWMLRDRLAYFAFLKEAAAALAARLTGEPGRSDRADPGLVTPRAEPGAGDAEQGEQGEQDVAQEAATLLRIISSRRVVRAFSDRPVARADLIQILTAGRWATRGSNSRIHRFLVVEDPSAIRRVRAFSPGMLGVPAAIVVICTDGALADRAEVQLDRDVTPWFDVGTAAMNMMLAAHALGLGSCPVTSFSKSAVGVVLRLPPGVAPEFIVQVGHPAESRRAAPRPPSAAALRDLVCWETYRPHP